ncbi:hypothetical protein HDU77_000068 [Chytriomyces hyalinus]|nr:hypothetical protein HDU77_000068 [Chytriomyces hyalinus]
MDPVCSGNNWDRGEAPDPNAPHGPYPISGEQVYIQDPNNYCINLPNPDDPYLIDNFWNKGINPSFVDAEGHVRSFCVGALAPGALPMPVGAVTGAHVRTNQALNGKLYHQITGSLNCDVLRMSCVGDNAGQYDSVPYRNCGKEPYSGVFEEKNPGFKDYVEIGGDFMFCMRTCVAGRIDGDPCSAKGDTLGCGVLTGGTMDTSEGFTLNGAPFEVTTKKVRREFPMETATELVADTMMASAELVTGTVVQTEATFTADSWTVAAPATSTSAAQSTIVQMPASNLVFPHFVSDASLQGWKAKPVEPQWWMGGLSSALAAIATHPLDSLKVRMQTMPGKAGLVTVLSQTVKTEGVLVLYKGLDASMLRQLSYSTARFGVYEKCKERISNSWIHEQSPLAGRIAAASVGGIVGGIVGTPADLTNVRMQADGRLPIAEQRGYKTAFHGLVQTARQEGPMALFTGVGPNVIRAIPMTAGQIATYDTVKSEMLASGHFKDNLTTHFLASVAGAFVATTVCAPIDVIKSRIMAQKGGEYSGTWDCAKQIAKNEGLMAFMKGWTPAFARLGPHTILTFMIMEKVKSLYQARKAA